MEIKFLGHSCFQIKAKHASIVIDPYDEKLGLGKLKLKADIVLITHDHSDHNNPSAVLTDTREPFVINGPGEYEVNGVIMEGVGSYHDDVKGEERGRNTIYTIFTEGIRVCHLGDLGHLLTDNQISKIGQVDVLMIPIGGTVSLDAAKAIKVVNQLEPKMILPMHFKEEGLIAPFEPLTLEDFLKQESIKIEKVETLKIDKKTLPVEEDSKIIVFER
jgi:L-ascorbate metabolism protein UlaG (beta-lactamase superfamily)